MALIVPPPPAGVAASDHDGKGRLRLRLLQLVTTFITVLATAWLCTLGLVPGLIGLLVAKHVLVAVLVMGLGVNAKVQER
jgi:hypothetical protein